MIQINLVPDVKQQLIHIQEMRNRVTTISIAAGLISVLAVVVMAVYTFGAQTYMDSTVNSDIDKQAKTFNSNTDLTKMLTIQNQLDSITVLHDSENYNSRIAQMLSVIMPSSISYSTLTIDSDAGTITMEGQTVPGYGYSAYETFKKTLDSAVVEYKNSSSDTTTQQATLATNITIPSTSYGIDATGNKVVRFTIVFTYAKELLSPLALDAKVAIVGAGDQTDSYLGLPSFVKKASDI